MYNNFLAEATKMILVVVQLWKGEYWHNWEVAVSIARVISGSAFFFDFRNSDLMYFSSIT